MIIRGGQPKVIANTAAAVPGAAVKIDDGTAQPYIWHEGRATVWLRIRNTDSTNVLRVFFTRRDWVDRAPADYKNFITIPIASANEPNFIEGLFELEEMSGPGGGGLYLMGVGGTCDFEAVLGLRVV